MIDEKQEVFNAFMNEFVKLNKEQKNKEIIEKQKEIVTFLWRIASDYGINFEFLKSKEINDVEQKIGTDEDYLEAMMVYSQNIEELLGAIFEKNNNI